MSTGDKYANGIRYIMSVIFSNTNLINLTTGDSPVVVDPYFANVVLLLHCDGSDGSTTFTDNSLSAHTPVSVVAPVSITNSSGRFNGAGNFTGGYFQYTPSTDWNFGSGNFTVECFTNFNAASAGSRAHIVGQANNIGGQYPWGLNKQTGNTLGMAITNADTTLTSAISVNTVSINTWYHVAMVRSGSNFYLWVNGVLWASMTSSQALYTNNTNRMGIGIDGEYTYSYGGAFGTLMMGLMDEVRFTKGVARYTSAFTPPSAPFPNF